MDCIQHLKDDITNRSLIIDGIICVCDDSGGEPVTNFTDEAAIKLFLDWLGSERAREKKERLRQEEATKRRNHLKLVANIRPKNDEP